MSNLAHAPNPGKESTASVIGEVIHVTQTNHAEGTRNVASMGVRRSVSSQVRNWCNTGFINWK